VHGHGEGGYVRREELRGNGSCGAVWVGEKGSAVAGCRIGEDDACVAVEEFVDVVVFCDEDGAAPVERAAGCEETCFVEQGFGGVVHAGSSPRAFSESGKDAEAVEELEGLFGRFCFEEFFLRFAFRGWFEGYDAAAYAVVPTL